MNKEVNWLRKIKVNKPLAEGLTKSSELPLDQIRSLNTEKEDTKASEPDNPVNGFRAIAGMENLKDLITNGFINVIKNPRIASLYGVSVPNLLLYGPAGCGKTFFAEKVAEEIGINFMKISPDELSSIYVHGTQKKIGELFKKAQENAPTLLFLDEFNCMVPKRSNDPNRQYQTDEVDEFLTMLNNTHKRGIYIIAATNHPENIDSSILRTGRIDEKIYVPMPDKSTREKLFRLELHSRPVTEDIDYNMLSEKTSGFNCSDISYIVKTAAREKFNKSLLSSEEELISQSDIENIISQTSPSVTEKDIRSFEMMYQEMSPKQNRSNKHRIGFI